jgi:hypothetical protein
MPDTPITTGALALDWVSGTFNQPTSHFARLAALPITDRMMGLAGLIVVVVSVLDPLLTLQDPLTRVLMILATGLNGVILWVTVAGLMHGLARLGSAAGSFRQLLVCSAQATLPWLLLPCAWVMQHANQPAVTTLVILAKLALAVWCFALFCMAFCQVYGLSWRRAALTLALIPLCMLFGIGVLVVWSAGLLKWFAT